MPTQREEQYARRATKLEKYREHLETDLETLKGASTPQAEYARNALTSKLRAVKEALASYDTDEIVRTRTELTRAESELREINAQPLPRDEAAELKRLARRNVLERKRGDAHDAYHAALGAAKLLTVAGVDGWQIHHYKAFDETKHLVEVGRRSDPKTYEPAYCHDSVDMAHKMGRTITLEVAPYLAVAEQAYRDEPAAVVLFEHRWAAARGVLATAASSATGEAVAP